MREMLVTLIIMNSSNVSVRIILHQFKGIIPSDSLVLTGKTQGCKQARRLSEHIRCCVKVRLVEQ